MAIKTAAKKRELAVVMPVYNEEVCIVGVINAWRAALSAVGADFEMIVLNDGSRDRTAELLDSFKADERITLIHKRNEGHGPTTIKGYTLAADRAEWVFQVDSDNEMRPEHFAALWNRRLEFDALFGERTGRDQGAARAILSFFSRHTVLALFGGVVRDVNTPYRLIRAEVLADILRKIPPDTFAPNVLLTGMLALIRARVLTCPVPFESKQTSSFSLRNWRLVEVASRSFFQTIRFRVVCFCKGVSGKPTG